MRVLLASELHLANTSGYLNALLAAARYLDRLGHDVEIVVPSGGPAQCEFARVVSVPAVPLPFYRELRVTLPSPTLARHVLRARPDFVHLFQPTCLGLYVALIARICKIPMVASFHGNIDVYCDFYGLSRLRPAFAWWVRKLHSFGKVVLAPSPSAVDRLRGLGMDRVVLWGRGVDGDSFCPDRRNRSVLERYGLDATRPVCLYVGRVGREKGLELLIELAKAVPSVQLLIVGDGPYRAELSDALLPWTSVRFLGYRYGRELQELYASADVFVFPSRTETFGQVVLEAMASGLPVVAFTAPGTSDLVLDGVTGVLADSSEEWIQAVASLSSDESACKRAGTAGRERALTYTWDAAEQQLAAAYSSVAGHVGRCEDADASRDAPTTEQRCGFRAPGVEGRLNDLGSTEQQGGARGA